LTDLCKRYEENFGNQSSFKNSKGKYLSNFKEGFGADRLLSTSPMAKLKPTATS